MARRWFSALLVSTALSGCIASGDSIDVVDDDLPLDGDDENAEDRAAEAAESYVKAKPGELRAGCTATGMLGGHRAWIHFTRPDDPCAGAKGSGVDHHVVDELIRLIDSVPDHGRIDAHIYSITTPGVARALLDAQRKRSVEVFLSTDGQVAGTAVAHDFLDQLDHHVYCKGANNHACIGTGEKTISHTKLFVFSAATAPDGTAAKDVVWFGSANQTRKSGMSLYNNTVTVYGDSVLHSSLQAYLKDLYAQRKHADYYDAQSGRGHLLAESADVYVSPELDTDLVINRLNDVTLNDRCTVQVQQAEVKDSRMDVVEQLVRMKKGGCTVSVAAGHVGDLALDALRAAHIPVHRKPIHDKVFLVHAKYGDHYELRVYTGSHNLSGGANSKSDEIFVKLAAESPTAAHPVWDAYQTHFAEAFAGHSF